MALDPGTWDIIEAGAKLGAEAISAYKNKKLKKKQLKEEKRHTEEDLFHSHLDRAYKNAEHSSRSGHKSSSRRAQVLKNTAANVRGALL